MRRRTAQPHRRPRRSPLPPIRLGSPGAHGAIARFATLADFYGEDPRRAASREIDVGLWWRERADEPLHRAAWVQATGELYAVRLGPAGDTEPAVELLARFDSGAAVETALDGWRERCGEPRSLAWLRRRAAIAALDSRLSAERIQPSRAGAQLAGAPQSREDGVAAGRAALDICTNDPHARDVLAGGVS